MRTHADKTKENKSQSVSNGKPELRSGGKSTFQFIDNRPEAVAQRKLQEIANNSTLAIQLRAFQDRANNGPQFNKVAQLQAIADNYSAQKQQPIQKKKNNTGLPDNLKTGMENLSGISLDDVKVHRNSDKPAQLQAHAYAQGTDIHLGAGQEKHLPHEAWHVVQQKQGRVKPTMQMKGGVSVNDELGLETEADVMGLKALSTPAQLKQSAELIQGKFSTIQLVGEGDNEQLLQDDISIEEQFGRIQRYGRIAVDLEKKIKSRRRDDVMSAATELAKIWGKASLFAALDVAAPGLGTGLGYADAAVGAAKDLNHARKTRGVKSTAMGAIAENAVNEGATKGLEAGVGGLHYAAGAGIASIKQVGNVISAVGQNDSNRKGGKIASILEFKTKIASLEEVIINECDDLFNHFELGSRSDGPTKKDDKNKEQVVKARKRLIDLFYSMTQYCNKNSEYVPLMGQNEGSSSDTWEGE